MQQFVISLNLRRLLNLTLLVLLGVFGCTTPAPETTPEVTPETTAVIGTSTLPQETLSPTSLPALEPTVIAPAKLAIWWPDMLAGVGGDGAPSILAEQLRLFEITEGNVTIDFRLKRVGDVGGIMSTLRSANRVAPGALPDVTLIRREDLVSAVRSGLIQPLEGRVPTAILGDLYTPVLQLGVVDGALYGLPYALTIQHVIYNNRELPNSAITFDEVLEAEESFTFPAARATGVNSVFLAQYYAAGGEPLTATTDSINADALLTVLQFYERAVALGVVDSTVLDYTSPEDYRFLLDADAPGVRVVTSSLYLELQRQGGSVRYAPLPTQDGNAATTTTGWLWVLVTPDINRQTLALRFLDWMMETERQAGYLEALNMLPSQRTAFLFWSDQAYASFAGTLLSTAYQPLSDEASGVAARALQNALVAVISQNSTAEEAVEDVINQLNSQ